MIDVVCVADIHEGINFGFRVDPDTGVSDRALDLHRNFASASNYAIENRARLFVILGDLFDRTNVAPIFREMVRRDVIEPLGKAGVEVWIIAGNHDQPRSFSRSTSLEDFRGYPHVKVFRESKTMTMDFNGQRVGFIVLPYLHPEQVIQLVKEKLSEDVSRGQMFEVSRRLWKEWIRSRASELRVDYLVLFAHYYVEGARMTSETYLETLPGEFSITQDMIPEEVNLAILGHIHLHQCISGKIVYTGAPERIDWGERADDKGFLVLDLASKAWRFEKLPTRDMIRIDVVLEESNDPTRALLDALPADVNGKMIRLFVALPEGLRVRIDENAIAERMREAFSYEVKWQTLTRENVLVEEVTLDPRNLLRSYVQTNYAESPDKEVILSEAERILREVLS